MFVKRDTPSPGGSDRSRDGVHCDLCGSSNPAVRCDKCNGHAFCLSCDDMYHRHPKRKQHLRKAIDSFPTTVPPGAIRQPSGQRTNVPGDPSKMPIPPPRKKKGKSFFPGFGNEVPALPKKEFSLTEKIGSIKRFMSNRPLPPIPKHELPLQQGAIPPKPRAASPKKPPTNDRQMLNNRTRNARPPDRSGSPEYQNILAHLTKVAQNSADEWEEEPSVSTSGSTRGSSGGEDVGWGQDVTPLSKSGAPPPLRNKNEDMDNTRIEDWQNFGTLQRGQMQRAMANQEGLQNRMLHSTSMGNLQSGYPVQQLPGTPGFFPAPYPNFFAQGGVPPAGYPGAYPNYPGQFPRGSWNNMQQKGEEEEEYYEGEEEEDDPAGGGTLTKANKSQMKRSQSVMHDPMMAHQGSFFPFGAMPPGYPGYFPGGFPPYWSPHPGQKVSAPASPNLSTRSLNRKQRGRSRKHSVKDDEAYSPERNHEGSRRGSRLNRQSDSSEREPSSEDGGDFRTRRNEHRRQEEPVEEEPKESKEESSQEVEEEEDKPPTPPPPIPTVQWECSFCTFINPAGGRVCSVCCKTIASPSSNDDNESLFPEPKSQKDELQELKEKKKKAKEEFLNFSPEFIKEQQDLEEEIRKRLERNRRLSEGFPGEPTSRRSSVTEVSVRPPTADEESSQGNASNEHLSPPPSPSPPQHSKPVSVTTGTSPEPPAEINEIKDKIDQSNANRNAQVVSDHSQSNSNATEPSVNTVKKPATSTAESSCQTTVEQPDTTNHNQGQSIAIGTDNVSEISHDDSLNSPPAKVEMGTSPPNNTEFSQNLFDRPSHFSNLQRSVSQSSLRDDLLYQGRQLANDRREDFNRGQLLRSLSRASLVSEPGMFGMQDAGFNRAPDSPFMQRKNISNDFRKRRPSDFSSRDYYNQPQQQGGWYQRGRNDYMSMDDLLERRRQDTIRAQGMEMVRLIRKAELSGFLPDDLQVALNHCAPDQDPIDWLEENWTNMIETVVTLATNYGHDKPENDVGIISAGEAKEALRIHRGNIWASVTECVESRQGKFLELRARGNFTRREIVAALTANQGNLEFAYSELTRSTHKPFSLNIWGPGSGVENLDGSRTSPSEAQMKGVFDRYNDRSDGTRLPHLQHRKQHLGDNTNIHRSMLALNTIGLEDDFKPLDSTGRSPRLTRRFSFTGRTNDISSFSPNFNRMNLSKTNYDASDSMSITSEDFESMDVALNKDAARDPLPRETPRTSRKKKSTSTTFLNKLASLRKTGTKPKTESQDDVKTEPESDVSESDNQLKKIGKSTSVQQLNRTEKEAKPQRRSFLQRIMNTPASNTIRQAQSLQDFATINPNALTVNTLMTNELKASDEFSSIEKVQAYLNNIPPEESRTKPEPKAGFLQRLGLKKKEGSIHSPPSSEAKNSPKAGLSPTESADNLIPTVDTIKPPHHSKEPGNLKDTALSYNQKNVEISQATPIASAPITEDKRIPEVDVKSQIKSAKARFFDSPISTGLDGLQLGAESSPISSGASNHFKRVEEDPEEPLANKDEPLNVQDNSAGVSGLPNAPSKSDQTTASSSKDLGLVVDVSSVQDEKVLKKQVSPKKSPPPSKFTTDDPKSADGVKPATSPKAEAVKLDLSPKLKSPNVEKSKDERIIRREVKEELIEEREKTKEEKLKTKGETRKPKAEIVQTKLEIVETIVEIVKSKDDKSKSKKAGTESTETDQGVKSKTAKDAIDLTKEKPENVNKDSSVGQASGSIAQARGSTAQASGSTANLHKGAKDISYPVSRFAKPREPLFSFKEKTKNEEEKSKLVEEKNKEDDKKSTATSSSVEPVEKEADPFSNVPTSPTTGLPLKSILKKPSGYETATTEASARNDVLPLDKPLKHSSDDAANKPTALTQRRTPSRDRKNEDLTKVVPLGLFKSSEPVEDLNMASAFSAPLDDKPSKSTSKTNENDVVPTDSRRSRTRATKASQDLDLKESSVDSLVLKEKPTTDSSSESDLVSTGSRRTRARPTKSNKNLAIEVDSASSASANQSAQSSTISPKSVQPSTMSPKSVDKINIEKPSAATSLSLIEKDVSAKSEELTTAPGAPQEPATKTTDESVNQPTSMSQVPTAQDDTPSVSQTNNEKTTDDGKVVRRRRRNSDVEESSQAPPLSSTLPRRRRSMSTERSSTTIYRTRERKPTTELIDNLDIDITDEMLANEELESSKSKDETVDESNETANANDQRFSSLRVRRQRSISRDRLSRTPSATDSGREGILPCTSDILKIAKPSAVDSVRERRRSMSFEPKGRFAEARARSNSITKALKYTGDDVVQDRAVSPRPSISVAPAAILKPVSKTEGPKKAAIKKIDPTAPVMSSKRLMLDNKIKDLLDEGKCENYEQAETAARLMEMNFDEDEALDASKECGTLYQAISYLSQDCELCAGKYPVADMVSMVNCTHRACRDCLTAYFTIQIRDRNILELICPFCNEPDLTNDDIASDYFNHMDLLLKNLVDTEIHELFQRKLRDRVLMKDPLFRWCSQCSSGFIITNPNQKRLLCPDCKAVTCATCRKRWEKQHEGLTCDKYLAWKEANDPEVQAAGLAQHLAENGIDCPNCHFRYSLAKGGCMHFRCVQCQFDFCSGCGKPFKMGQKCGVSDYCSKLGLHAHHPRNCLFYLRDKEPADLQKLLDQNNVTYNTQPPEGMEVKIICQVMEQKEVSEGLMDDICGKDVLEGYAGLCRLHYIEFLVALINQKLVDPIPIMDVHDLQIVLQRGQKPVPEYEVPQSEEQYKDRLMEVIKEELPLEKIEGSP